MTPETVVHIISQAFWLAFILCAPILAVGFAASVIVNLIQIFTSLQDAAFSTVPRLGAFLVGFLFFLPWMLKKLSAYAVVILGDLGRYAH